MLVALAQIPVLQQFSPVKLRPVQHQLQRSPGQFPFDHVQRLNVNRRFELAVLRVKVRRRVFVENMRMMIP
jgi:hypothetical protein